MGAGAGQPGAGAGEVGPGSTLLPRVFILSDKFIDDIWEKSKTYRINPGRLCCIRKQKIDVVAPCDLRLRDGNSPSSARFSGAER